MRITKFYRYIITEEVPGRFWRRSVNISPGSKLFKWLKYRIFSSTKKEEKVTITWRLDGRSVSRLEGIQIVENKPEEAELWTT